MAKITLENGTVLEGSVEELRQMGVKFPEQVKPLEVGDYAKVVIESFTTNGFDVGDIVELETNYVGKSDFKISSIDGESSGFANRHMLVRATDEEVAEAKRQQAEKAVADKWAKIGRKPNEFKKGDIVCVIDSSGSSQRDGNIGEITQVDNDSTPYRVNSSGITYGNFLLGSQLELITPVEHRFDLTGGESE